MLDFLSNDIVQRVYEIYARSLVERNNLKVRYKPDPTAKACYYPDIEVIEFAPPPSWATEGIPDKDIAVKEFMEYVLTKRTVAHECAHAIYSSKKIKLSSLEPIVGEILNALEDVRVERKLGNRYSGIDLLFTIGYRIYGEKATFLKDAPETTKKILAMMYIAKTGKIPGYLRTPEVEGFIVRNIDKIQMAVRADSTEDVLEIAKEIAKNEFPDTKYSREVPITSYFRKQITDGNTIQKSQQEIQEMFKPFKEQEEQETENGIENTPAGKGSTEDNTDESILTLIVQQFSTTQQKTETSSAENKTETETPEKIANSAGTAIHQTPEDENNSDNNDGDSTGSNTDDSTNVQEDSTYPEDSKTNDGEETTTAEGETAEEETGTTKDVSTKGVTSVETYDKNDSGRDEDKTDGIEILPHTIFQGSCGNTKDNSTKTQEENNQNSTDNTSSTDNASDDDPAFGAPHHKPVPAEVPHDEEKIKKIIEQLSREYINIKAKIKAQNRNKLDYEKLTREIHKFYNTEFRQKFPEYRIPLFIGNDSRKDNNMTLRGKYTRQKNELRQHINTLYACLQNILYSKKLPEYNKRHGKLSSRELWKINTIKETKVFYQKPKKEMEDIAIYMLIDCSGSMSMTNLVTTSKGEYRERIDIAKDTAIIFAEVMEKLKIPFAVTGYCERLWGSAELQVTRYLRFDRPEEKYNLVNIHAGDFSPHGPALAVATQELLARKEKTKVLIIITDGYPESKVITSDTGYLYTSKAVKMAEKLGVKMVNFYIGDKNNHQKIKKIFAHNVTIDKPEHLPTIVGRFIANVIKKM